MGGAKSLRRGAPRLLGRHDGPQGRSYAQAYADIENALGPFTSRLVRFEAGRTALAHVNLMVASRALADARRARERGRGRRPSVQQLERLQRRQALQDQSYAAALGQLRAFAGPRREQTLHEYLAKQAASGGRDAG